MSDYQHPGARNPKVARFTITLSEEINARVEAVADRAGQNKTVMAGMLVAAGLTMLEPLFQIGVQQYIDTAVDAKMKEMQDALAVISGQK